MAKPTKIGTSGWVIISAFVLWLGVTLTENMSGRPGISTTLQAWATTSNSFAYLFGCLFGHWFYPVRNWLPTVTKWPWLLLPIGLLAIGDVTHAHWLAFPDWLRHPGIWATLGIPSGAMVWSSKFEP